MLETLPLKKFFGFAAFTEADTSHVAQLAYTLGQAFSARVHARKYGAEVKHVTAGLILTNPAGLGKLHKVRRPKYSPGSRTIKAHGLTASLEDTLEFDLRPSFDEVRNARTPSEIAAAILPAVSQVKPALLKLKVTDFDMTTFLSDLEGFLAQVKHDGLAWTEVTAFNA